MIFKCAVIYISAVLLLQTVETNGSGKLCNIRNDFKPWTNPPYPQEIWNHLTGFYCYHYTNSYRLLNKYNVSIQPYDNNTVIPILKDKSTDPETVYYFDYKDFNSTQYIKKSFKTESFFQMWLDCCREAEDCCDRMDESNIYPTEEYPCPAIWDSWTCFDPAKAGSVQHKTCSKQAYSTTADVCELQSAKRCFANGTWNQQTDYGSCAMAPVLRKRHTFNVVALAVATFLAFPAVVIFFSLRTFRRNLRYVLHRNLILVIVIRNLLSITSKEIIILDALNTSGNHVMEKNSVDCRVLAFFENAAKNAMYATMLADGFYLHKLIVRPFADEPSYVFIYAVVTCLSFLPSLVWATVRGVHQGANCWMVDDTNDQWIIDGFRIGILVINFVFLIDIIRVMILKLKRGNVSQQAKSTLRATLFLIPLFGVHILFIMNRGIVPGNTCQAEDIYYYISYLIEGLQGVMVAILFCYINAEVQKELKNSMRKFVLYLESRFDFRLGRHKPDMRRATTGTFC